MGAAGGVGADQGVGARRYFFGSWARASWVAVMWSAAVLDPAFPGRSRAATGSPVPPRSVVDEPVSG